MTQPQSPTTTTRTIEQVQQEHNNVAFRVGVVNYQIKCLEDELAVLYPRMLLLNEEGAKLMEAAKKSQDGTLDQVAADMPGPHPDAPVYPGRTVANESANEASTTQNA